MAKTIDQVIAEAEIKDLHIRFCRANDRRDEDLMRGCFHPDATVQLHQTLDLEAFIAFGRAMLGNYAVTWHDTGNQLVEVDGDAAWAEHYTISSHRTAASDGAPGRDMVVHGRYVDRVERRGGEWRFARRLLLIDYVRSEPIMPAPAGSASGSVARDRSDPSYMWRLRG